MVETNANLNNRQAHKNYTSTWLLCRYQQQFQLFPAAELEERSRGDQIKYMVKFKTDLRNFLVARAATATFGHD